MIMRILQIVLGYLLACMAAGATLVAFIHTPAELATLSGAAFMDRLSDSAVMALAVGTQVMIFASLFSLITVVVGEWFGLRSWIFYAIAASAIALVGFLAQFYTEGPQQPSIVNNYALLAFLTTSLVAATMYWLVAGHRAGRRTRVVMVIGEPAPSPPPPRQGNQSSVPEIDPGRSKDIAMAAKRADEGSSGKPTNDPGSRPRMA